MRLTILTPVKSLLRVEDVARVRLRLADGKWLSIYPHHAPLLAETLPGPLQYEGQVEAGAGRRLRTVPTESVEVAAGILQVAAEEVTLFTSGWLHEADALPAVADGGEEAARFDRLARTLLLTLNAHVGQEEMPGQGMEVS